MANAKAREPTLPPGKPRKPDLRPDHTLDVDSVSQKLIAKFPKILAKLAE